MTDVTKFRDLSGLAAALKATLGVYMAIVVISLWSGWLEIELLQRAANGAVVSETEAAASDSRQALLGGLYFVIFVVTAVLFLRWTYLSNRNVRSLGADDLEFTPAWAVGWYFIPIATLWKPYQALKETFKASHPDFTENWRQAPRPAIMPLWWTLWILANFVGQAILRTAFREETIDELLASSWLTFLSDALDLPMGIVVIMLVSKLKAWQSEKLRRVGGREMKAPRQAALYVCAECGQPLEASDSVRVVQGARYHESCAKRRFAPSYGR